MRVAFFANFAALLAVVNVKKLLIGSKVHIESTKLPRQIFIVEAAFFSNTIQHDRQRLRCHVPLSDRKSREKVDR
jgi:hypothetical protein